MFNETPYKFTNICQYDAYQTISFTYQRMRDLWPQELVKCDFWGQGVTSNDYQQLYFCLQL